VSPDYSSAVVPASVLLPANSRQNCFSLAVLDDRVALEPDSSFSLLIDRISPFSSRVEVPVSRVMVNIQDDDGVCMCAL